VLIGKRVDHSSIGWAMQRISPQYLNELVYDMYLYIDCILKDGLYITDSTGFMCDRYEIEDAAMKEKKIKQTVKLHIADHSGNYCYDEQLVRLKGKKAYRLTFFDAEFNIPVSESARKQSSGSYEMDSSPKRTLSGAHEKISAQPMIMTSLRKCSQKGKSTSSHTGWVIPHNNSDPIDWLNFRWSIRRWFDRPN
jgi:hypothetical protein